MPSKVFISHSSKDQATADAICAHLESAGIKCWIAPRDIEPGANWTKGIMQGLEACRVLILVFSEHANNSDHVEREVAKAFSSGLAVIPFRIKDVSPNQSLSYFLDTVQWLDGIQPPLERHLEALTKQVNTLLTAEEHSVANSAEIAPGKKASFYQELRSKRIYRIAGGYIVSAWIVLQAASILVPSLELPSWTMKAVLGVLLAGFSGALYTGFRLDLRTAQIGQKQGRFHFVVWPAIVLFLIGGIILVLTVWTGSGAHDKSAATAAPSTVSAKSIAVLPFESLSANKDDTYFADGVQDEILNNLAKVAQLTVISRTSVMQYRADEKRDLRQIANALGVANVLEGTVRRNGNRVRVSTELIDARLDKTTWADSFDRDLTDIFAIQSEVAQTIATKLAATLSPEEKRSIEKKPTENLEAYDLYLRAKELLISVRVSMTFGDVEKPLVDAIGFLEQAVRLDPKFALAFCASAEAHDLLYYLYYPTPEQRALGDAAVNSALSLQPDLPEVHLAYAGHLYRVYRDYERARVQLAIARRGLPNDAEAIALEALMDRRQGQFPKAIQEFNEAITRDPHNSAFVEDLAVTLSNTRQFRAAEQQFDRLIELRPDQPMLKAQKPFVTFFKSGDDTALRTTIAAFPASMADDRGALTLRLAFAFVDRDWPQAKEIIEKMNGGDDEGYFAYGQINVPVSCYSILLARLQGEQPRANASFAETREQLNQKVQKSPGNAYLLSQLAVTDALLNNKEVAISEAKRAVELLPVSKDAMAGPSMEMNLAIVYAWTNELDLAFEKLSSLTNLPSGIFYGQLKRDPYWEPLRKDPRYEKLLAEMAPRD